MIHRHFACLPTGKATMIIDVKNGFPFLFRDAFAFRSLLERSSFLMLCLLCFGVFFAPFLIALKNLFGVISIPLAGLLSHCLSVALIVVVIIFDYFIRMTFSVKSSVFTSFFPIAFTPILQHFRTAFFAATLQSVCSTRIFMKFGSWLQFLASPATFEGIIMGRCDKMGHSKVSSIDFAQTTGCFQHRRGQFIGRMLQLYRSSMESAI